LRACTCYSAEHHLRFLRLNLLLSLLCLAVAGAGGVLPNHAALLLPRRRGLLRTLIGGCSDVLPRLFLPVRVLLRIHDALTLRVLRCRRDASVDDALTRLLLLLLLLLLPLLLLLEGFPLRLQRVKASALDCVTRCYATRHAA